MTLRVACLGAGYFAQFHIDAWQRIPSAKLVAVCDRDLPKAEATGVEAYDDLKRMLKLVKPDIIDIATPPQSHATAIRMAIKSRPKAIICQKPFATSISQAQGLAVMAKSAGIPLIIHDNFRFQPWYRAIKAAIDAGQIGDLYQVSFRLRTGDGQGPHAYMDRQPYFQTMPRLLIHETGVHFVDVFRYLMGRPRDVYADLRRLNPAITGEDAGHFILGHANGTRAVFDGNRLADHNAQDCRVTLGEAVVEGSLATLTLTGDGSVTLRKHGQTTTTSILAPQNWQGFGGDCVHALCTHIVETLSGRGAFENEAMDYLEVLKTVEAVYQSDRRGVKVDL